MSRDNVNNPRGLGWYTNLGQSTKEGYLMPTQERLRAILNQFVGSDGKILGTHTAVATAYLEYAEDDREVRLKMYPADTLEQARVFYNSNGDRPNVVRQILTLEQHEGWRVAPNFHFGYWIRGYCWTTVRLPLAEYMSYWQNNITNTKRVQRPDWNEYWHNLAEMGIAEREGPDREEFDRQFTKTDRPYADPRPGIGCMFVWSLNEAERLDAQGQLTNAVRERINQLLEALDEPLI
jgi:hypothetical protein